jgi:DNA polymerase III epsilon subunit-like protein
MHDFAAIDFETANFERTSVCSVGVVVVRDGKKVDDFYSLIHPEPDYYNIMYVPALTDYAVRTPRKHPSFLKYGSGLSQRLKDYHL